MAWGRVNIFEETIIYTNNDISWRRESNDDQSIVTYKNFSVGKKIGSIQLIKLLMQMGMVIKVDTDFQPLIDAFKKINMTVAINICHSGIITNFIRLDEILSPMHAHEKMLDQNIKEKINVDINRIADEKGFLPRIAGNDFVQLKPEESKKGIWPSQSEKKMRSNQP